MALTIELADNRSIFNGGTNIDICLCMHILNHKSGTETFIKSKLARCTLAGVALRKSSLKARYPRLPHAPSFGVLGYLAVGVEREIVDDKMGRRDGVDITISKEDADDVGLYICEI
jgi:hypothetical protein